MATKFSGKGHVAAIYVHAGAGFHSRANERQHLECCEEAAKVAMKMLDTEGSAVNAVEMAIRFMEDRDSTNAGYGSNLNVNGIVENDACIVNHLGRSGACGAVPRVKNPISLARTILENTEKPQLMRRLPPNLLVGEGAIQFARDHKIPVLQDEFLIAPPAQWRWDKWHKDLQVAHEKELERLQNSVSDGEDQTSKSGEHAKLAENKPDVEKGKGPNLTSSWLKRLVDKPSKQIKQSEEASDITIAKKLSGIVPPGIQLSKTIWTEYAKDVTFEDPVHSRITKLDSPTQPIAIARNLHGRHRENKKERSIKMPGRALPNREGDGLNDGAKRDDAQDKNIGKHDDKDKITDTVGAIAVDCYGNIAAGSSSGGIGLKHTGRIGPAALVGIGTAVIPINPNDPEKTCVAVVASGTGEHITTATAAGTCASRIYFGHKIGDFGELETVSEEEALRSMIVNEFAGHPGVLGAPLELDDACIGLMAVKKTREAVYLYFAHNSESFALASMCSGDQKPSSVMSRSFSNGSVAQGGRVFRVKRYKAAPIEREIERSKPKYEQKGFHIAEAKEE